MDQDKIYWHAAALIENFGTRKIQKLAKYFGTIKVAWEAPILELVRAGLSEMDATIFTQQRQGLDVERELQELERQKIKFLTLKDLEYPKYLKEIYDAPAILYIRGNLDYDYTRSLAVVGTRKISGYGRIICQELVRQVASANITIISGLALGVDSEAHLAALEARQKTIAVLGSGISDENIYPRQNFALAKKIIESGGAIISEFPPAMNPQKGNFPMRNRIISGLSRATLVVEAPEGSGALITAQSALEQNREVFAIPGNIYSENSAGTNKLIKIGAAGTVICAQDIFDALDITPITAKNSSSVKPGQPLTLDEKVVLDILSKEPTSINVLSKKANLPTSKLLALLTTMEIKNKVRNIGLMQYIKC